MKTPFPPLALRKARYTLTTEVISAKDLTAGAANKIKAWHQQVQKWQDADELDQAFSEGRLTYRTMTHEGASYQYGDQSESRKRMLGIINNDNYQRVITDGAQSEGGVWKKGAQLPANKTVRLDAGGAGIVRRLDPQNFVPQKPNAQSLKFQLGLHDLSASLLNPDGYKLKGYFSQTLVVLMPLPLAEDVKIFYQLQQLSKSAGSSAEFRSQVVILASEFTRPKIASSLDMGTTYVVATSARHGGDSIKYVKGVGSKVTSKDTPEQCRTNVTEDYRSILNPKSKEQANEITLAYRKHGTKNKFPSFAIAIPRKSEFVEVSITLPAATGGYADYAETGYVISGADFTKRKAPAGPSSPQ